MKIAIVTNFAKPLRPDAAGYFNSIYYLVEGLVKKGHEVVTLAHPESSVTSELIAFSPKGTFGLLDWDEQLQAYSSFLTQTANYGFDLINAHSDHMFCFFADLIPTPVVNTIRYGGFGDETLSLFKKFSHQNFSVNSHSLKKTLPFLNDLSVAYNGYDLSSFTFNNEPDDYFLYLARIHPHKGTHIAVQAAIDLDVPLILAGLIHDEDYYKYTVMPMLDNAPKIKYVGYLNFKEKNNYLKGARALLHPHLYVEAFGNSIVEAQACGVPVVAFDNGCSHEIVLHKETGFVVNNLEEMKTAMQNIDTINRTRCSTFVRNKFSVDAMVASYENIYRKILDEK